MENNNQNHQEEELKFDLARQYLPYWPLFVILVIIALCGAMVYLRYTTPIYQVSAKIMVKDEKKGLDESAVLDALDLFGEKKIVENETDIIRSWPLILQVVKDLDFYAIQWRKGSIRDSELYGTRAPVMFTALNEDSVGMVEKTPYLVDLKNKSITIAGKKVPFGSQFELGGSLFTVNENSRYIPGEESGTDEYYLQTINSFMLAKWIQSVLKVSPTSKQSTVITVELPSTVPKKGEDFINRLFVVYKNASLEDKNQVAQNTLTFVDERLGLVTKQLDSVEKNIEQYKTSAGIVDISAQGQLFLQSVKENDSKLAEINIQLGVLQDIEQYVNGKGPNPGTVPSVMGINEPTLVSLLNRLYDLDLQYQRLSAVTGEQNDQLVQLREQIAQLKPSLLENIRNVKRNLNVAKNSMSSEVSQTTAMLRTIPQKEKTLLEISRQQSIKNNIYTFLLQKREETALSYAAAVADSRIIESGKSTLEPIKPVPLLIYAIAVVLGIGLALLFVAFKEQLNNKVLFAKELENNSRVPVIGEVAYNPGGDEFVIGDGKRTIIAEQIRTIRGNLSYFGINEADQKVIMLTSSIPGEGKSFLSTNLAISIALTGKKVVLLELDLRRPKLSKSFGIERDKGISNFIVGKAEMEEIIKSTSFDGLFIISSGPIPPNPTELLLLPHFADLIHQLRNLFDYIIIDSPPVSLVSDAQLLAKFSDANLFVVRHNYTPKSALGNLRKLYDSGKYKNMSIVFNGVKQRGLSIYGKGYGSSYGYGNGSGYGYEYGGNYYHQETPKKKKKEKAKVD